MIEASLPAGKQSLRGCKGRREVADAKLQSSRQEEPGVVGAEVHGKALASKLKSLRLNGRASR